MAETGRLTAPAAPLANPVTLVRIAIIAGVLVMTYRPGTVKRMVPIELPRPRSSEIVSSDAFGHYVAQIWGDLREEASRGMRDDEAHRGGRAP